MNEHRLYNLRYFEPVMQMKNHTEFLQAFRKSLVWGMRMQANASTELDFCLLLQLLHWEVDVPLFRQMRRRLDSYHSYESQLKGYGRSLFSALRNQKKMRDTWQAMEEIPMMITLQEMATLATTFYYEQGWGEPKELKRELEMTTF